MKKFLIAMLFISLISCRNGFNGSGIITDKGIDKIDIKAMMDGLNITSTEKDKNTIEMYWIRLNTCDDKIYINLFSYEDMDTGEFIILGPEHSDIRFDTDF